MKARLVALLLVPVAVAVALIVWIMVSAHVRNFGPMVLVLAATVPAAYAMWHAAEYRSRADWAMRATYGLLGGGMLWGILTW